MIWEPFKGYHHLPIPQFFQVFNKIQSFVYYFDFFHFHSVVCGNGKILSLTSSFLFVNLHCQVFWLGSGEPFVYESLREFYAFHFLKQILVYAYTVCQHGQILISCTILNGSTFLPNYTNSCIPLMLLCCIHLLCN